MGIGVAVSGDITPFGDRFWHPSRANNEHKTRLVGVYEDQMNSCIPRFLSGFPSHSGLLIDKSWGLIWRLSELGPKAIQLLLRDGG